MTSPRALFGGTDDARGTAGALPATPGSYGLPPSGARLPDATRLGPVRLQVADLDRSLDFYGTALGMHVLQRDGAGALMAAQGADRPRSAWRRVGRELMMTTDPVDVDGVPAAAEGRPWTGLDAATTVGHVHLHVGDLARANAFFGDGLGFDRTVWSYPGATFLGAGGYHHHLGANTWAGPAARPAGARDARLLEWTIELPNATDVAAVAANLHDHGFASGTDGDDLVVDDPWGTTVRIAVG